MNKNIQYALASSACIYFWYYAKTYTEWHFIDNANLIFHEAGHTIFYFFGQFISIAMGSGLQILLPLFILVYFFIKNKNIEGSLCLMWTGQNFLNVSIYAGDAIKMSLDLLGGDTVIHDWNYLLGTTHLLKYTEIVGKTFYGIGIIIILIATVLMLLNVIKQKWTID